jgi:hypothetical protein
MNGFESVVLFQLNFNLILDFLLSFCCCFIFKSCTFKFEFEFETIPIFVVAVAFFLYFNSKKVNEYQNQNDNVSDFQLFCLKIYINFLNVLLLR